jgi:hypothetical protein
MIRLESHKCYIRLRWAAPRLPIGALTMLMAIAWSTAGRCEVDSDAKIDAEAAVSSGAKSLDTWWDYPWYDDQNDTIRRIDLKANRQPPPTQPATRNTRGSWDLKWLGWLLIAAIGIAVLFMMLRVYWNRSRGTSGTGKPGLVGALASIDRLEELPFQLERPEDDLLAAARRAADQQNYGQAMVFLYSHQLLELDRRDAIRLAKGKTNRQYLRELRRRPALPPLLATSMIAFEDVFFGGRSLSRERFEECWRQAMELLSVDDHREAA